MILLVVVFDIITCFVCFALRVVCGSILGLLFVLMICFGFAFGYLVMVDYTDCLHFIVILV